MSTGSEIILYTTEDGRASVQLRAEDGTIWLTQLEIAELFQTTKQNVSLHIQNILEEKELSEEATVKESLTVQTEGSRQVRRKTLFYNLDVILAVGYRVKSPRGTQFRQWATTHLREYLVKGFVMDDERLKNPGGWDYFDELLARIREIRASEKRFYQKVRDLYALSTDYRDNPEASALFFAETQNKMLFAVTGKTAAEIIVSRADPKQPNMNLQCWSGSRVRKVDIFVAKNYLTSDEVDTLNRIVVMFLDYADLQAKDRKVLTMDGWRSNLGRFITFNGRPLLTHNGGVSREQMQSITEKRYAEFDAARKEAERLAADAEDVKALEDVEKEIKKLPMGKKRKEVEK